MVALAWEDLKRYVEPAFGGPKRPTRHDLILIARSQKAPREVLETLERVDYGMNFSDLDSLQAYLLRQQLIRYA